MFGLIRIVLHNSYIAGKTTYIPCRGHTNNSGDNGAGKTSALRLIPIFYGKEPESIVDTSGGKKSFLDFYLPTTNSMVVFEYERNDGLCCAVIYRHPTANKITYRFVKSSFEQAFFDDVMRENLMNGMSISSALKEVSQKNIIVSKTISTVVGYRSIIQQDEAALRRSSREKNNLRKEAQEFCLGTSDSKMSDMHELASSLLNRDKMLPRLKQMIAHTKLGDYGSIAKPEHLQNAALLDDISSMRVFSKHEEDIQICINKSDEYSNIVVLADKTVSTLFRVIGEKETEHVKRLDYISIKDNDLIVKTDEHNEKIINLSGELAQKKSDLGVTSTRLEKIYERQITWANQDINTQISEYENLPTYESAASQAAEQFESLSKKVENAKLERQADLNGIDQRFMEDREPILDKKAQLKDTRTDVKEEGTEKVSKLRDEKSNAVSDLKDSLREEEITLRLAVQNINSEIKNMSATPEEELCKENAEQRKDALEAQNDVVKHKRDQTVQDKNSNKKNRDDAIKTLGSIKHSLSTKSDAHDELLKKRFPEDNTLLADLRSKDIHWAYDIGRVLNPELLQRKDLTPEYDNEASQETFFGWTLDLEQIELSDEALSDEVLDAKIQNLKVEMSSLNQQIKDEEKRILHLEREDTKHNGVLVNIDTALRELKNDIAAAKGHITQVQSDIRAAIESRQAYLHDKLKEAGKRFTKFESERQEIVDMHEKIYGQKVIDSIAHMNREVSKIDEDIEAQNRLLNELKIACDKRIKFTEEKYDERYRKEGLDPQIMREARQTKETTEAKLKEVKGYLHTITEHKFWLENEWGMVNKLEERESNLKLDVGARKITIQQLIEAHNESMKDTRSELENLRKLNRELKALINEARVVIGNNSFNADGPMLELRDLKLLTEKLKNTNISISSLGKEVSDGVRGVTRIFAKYSNSQVSEAWDNLENTRKNKSQQLEGSREFEIEQAQDLKILLSDFIPQIKGTLLENVRSFGQSICNYHETLKQISSKINKISKELGTAINSNQRIGSIRDVNIILESRIEQFECWEYLNRFSAEWEGWRGSHTTNELPTESVIEALRAANESLNNANIKDEKASLLNLKISMYENDNLRFISTDSDFNNSSSNGLSYLAICIVFMGMARYLCPDYRVQLAWPIDELAALSPNNIASLFAMMDEKNIVMFSAFPSEDPSLLKHFESKNLLSQTGIRRIAMKKAITSIEQIRRRNKAVKEQKAEAEGVVEA